MDKRAVYKSFAADAAKGELAFPTSAQVAMRVRRALDDPDCHIDTAAKLVQAEPLLSARVVAISNSVAFNRVGREITDVRTAVARLGFRTVRALATALVTRQLAGEPKAQAEQALAAQLWEHTAHVASLAHVIARRVTRLDPETALFAGIIHEVGGFYLLSRAKDFPGLLEGEMNDWFEFGEIEIGRALLKVLSVPEPVVAAIEAYWDGYLAMPPTTLADTLLLAEELSPIPSPLHRLGGKMRGEGMTGNLDMVIGETSLTSILEESEEEVGSLTGALQF
ncbi:MAG: HDOD domain-containing protein [Rhodocyclales bacterium]|nr:HDOD domain-containing protein [Rhodocyclales bacterium]